MSDEVAKQFESQKPEAPVSNGKSVTLSVTLHPDGSAEFHFPGKNKILSYGLVELARAQLDKIYLLDELKQSAPPRGGVEGLLKRMNGG